MVRPRSTGCGDRRSLAPRPIRRGGRAARTTPVVTVVDASVWVSRLVPQDVHHAASRRWLEEQAAGGDLLISPTLLLAEVAGALSRRMGQSELAHQAVQMLLRLTELRPGACPFRLTIPAAPERDDGRLAVGRTAPHPSEDTDPEQNVAKDRESEHRAGGREGRRLGREGNPLAVDVSVAGGTRRPGPMRPGGCTDDGGRRPWASRRSGLGRGAPPVWAPGRPCPGRGVFGRRGSR